METENLSNFVNQKNIEIIDLNSIHEILNKNSDMFYKIRCIIISNIDQMGYKHVLDKFRIVELEAHEFYAEEKVAIFYFFDYAIMYYALEQLKETKFIFQLGTKDLPYNQLLAFQAGASRHIFINQEKTQETDYIKKYNLKNIESNLYNEEKRILHFKFTKFSSALNFAFILQNKNLKFGFQRRKSDKLFSNLRTVYLGNVNTEAAEISEKIWGGDVFLLKLMKEKNVAFVTFINPQSCETFIKYFSQNELIINDKQCKVMKGNVSNIGLNYILEIGRGATRCLKINKSDDEEVNDKINSAIEFIKRNFTVISLELSEDENSIEIECLGVHDSLNIKEYLKQKEINDFEFMRDGCGVFNVFEGMQMC